MQTTRTFDGIPVKITYKKIKHSYLRVTRGGEVTLSVPRGTEDAYLMSILEKRADWIHEKVRMAEARTPAAFHYESGEKFPLFGEEVTLAVERGAGRARADLSGSTLILRLPLVAEDDYSRRRKLVLSFVSDALKQKIAERLPLWEARVGRRASSVTVRAMKTRWGSCTPRSGAIRLNFHLAAYPLACLDYVIVHELTHLWVAGHGADFWRRVGAVLPDWKQTRRLLSRLPRCPLA
ncbi:MAG: M48 family metallopeptidase [Eubacteriales bacterium]